MLLRRLFDMKVIFQNALKLMLFVAGVGLITGMLFLASRGPHSDVIKMELRELRPDGMEGG
jgi:hypothetical protein